MWDSIKAFNKIIIPLGLTEGELFKNLESKASAYVPLCLCPLCKGGSVGKDHIKSRFPACVERNGNPDGLRWQ